MNSRSGLTFADVLIILAVVLLLAALAVPRFIKAPDFGNEEDEILTNETTAATSAELTNRTDQTVLGKDAKLPTSQTP
ncbi:MAG: hypothetical protein WCI95_03585 [bacterium]